MKNQVESPLQILIKLLFVIFSSVIETTFIIFKLLYQLYLSLQMMAQTNIVGYFLAIFVGGIILFFTGKYILGGTTDVIKIMAIYIIIVVFLMSIVA